MYYSYVTLNNFWLLVLFAANPYRASLYVSNSFIRGSCDDNLV